MQKSPSQIQKRKDEHIEVALKLFGKSEVKAWFDCVKLVHNAFPSINFDDINIETTFLHKKIDSPIMIDALTGGTNQGKKINQNLAILAEKYQIPLGVGSQRILINQPEVEDTFNVVREFAPTIPIISNIGLSEIIKLEDFTPIHNMVSCIKADAIAIHLNPLQEIIQPDGNLNYQHSIEKILKFKEEIAIPIIIKEVGMGLSQEVILKLQLLGFEYFNVAGFGGSNFTLIEKERLSDSANQITNTVAETYKSWGIPTAASLMEAVNISKGNSTIFSSGGIRSGLDIGKSLALGAQIAGIAFPFLKYAIDGRSDLTKYMDILIHELKMCMFLTGITKLDEFSSIPKIILPPLKDWMDARIK